MLKSDKKGRKKRTYDRKGTKHHTNSSRKKRRWLIAGAGGILSAVAVVLMAVGMMSSTSKGLEQLKLVTNGGQELPADEFKVMNNAQVYIDGYRNDSGVIINYYFSEDSLDTDGMDLSSIGESYTEGSSITLNRSLAKDGVCYLYIQQKSSTESRISSFKITFYDNLGKASSTPATSDSQMTSLKEGDTIRIACEGTVYYTDDGSEPSFVRDSNGEIEINGERFRLGNPRMKKLDSGNKITVQEEWLSEESKTIRVISYRAGSDFSPVSIFRYRIAMDQAKEPSISPATTTENPTIVDVGTLATLKTATTDGVILYTTNGKMPVYSITGTTNGHQVTAGSEDTYIYSAPFPIEGELGEEVIITAITVKISTDIGIPVMLDSDPVQFVYQIRPLEVALKPEVSPESGTELALNSKIYLNTPTADGVILYTIDGSSPDYEICTTDQGYELVLKGNTQIYGQDASYIEAKEPEAQPGQTFLVLAKTILIDMTTGEKLLEDSSVGQYSFLISDAERVDAPTAIPKTDEESPAVVKEGSQILLSCTTVGADIYYTLDGTAPVINEDGTLAGNTKLYSGKNAIVVPAGTGFFTVTAMARKEEMNDSLTVQFNYRYPDAVAPPYVTPAEGTVSINTEVTLASIDQKAQIYYTLDGTEPTESTGRFYSEPILLEKDTVIKAICVVDGVSSAIRTFTFYVAAELLPPTPSIQSGAVVTSGTTIQLTAQKGAQIYYTLDGSSPKGDKAMSGSTVTLTGKAGDVITLTTYAKGSDYSDSQIDTYVYTISNYENGIKANPEAGSRVKEGDVITLETDVTNGIIYYAVGGDSPDTNGVRGTQVTVGESGDENKFTLKVTVVTAGSASTGTVASFIYEYMERPVAPKASIPDGAVLLEKQDIVLTAENGDIYYTLDGTDPDSKSDIYTGAIPITEAATIKAISISEEGAESEVATFSYTFAQQVQAPIFSVKNGEVESGTVLTITSATEGAVIYYTTDGQIPDRNNPKNLYIYSGAIVLNRPVNIKAIAVKDRMTDSEMTSAIYTVKEPEIILVDEETQEKERQENGDRLMSRRAYMDETGGPAYSDFVLKSVATGVVISAQEGAIPAETRIEVVETAVDNALNYSVESSVGREYGAVASYEISLKVGTEELQPEGDVEIGLPIPSQYQNSAISIAYVNEDGNVEIYETRRDNGMAYAHVTHFSRYCIVAPVNLDEEGTEGNIIKFLPVIVTVLLVTGYVLLRLGRKKDKEKNSVMDD